MGCENVTEVEEESAREKLDCKTGFHRVLLGRLILYLAPEEDIWVSFCAREAILVTGSA
jgi:hypothetical protein